MSDPTTTILVENEREDGLMGPRHARKVIKWITHNSMITGIDLDELVDLFDGSGATMVDYVQYIIDTLNDSVDEGYYSLDSAYSLVVDHYDD